MNRYDKGKIYKIVSPDFKKCYIGSTTETLSKRMERHRKYYKTYLETGKVDTRSCRLFDEYGIENCKILLIQYYPCERKEELLRKEGEYIQATECVNKNVAGRTHKEYKDTYKEYFQQKQRENYEKNKDYNKQRDKTYREQHKEYIQERTKQFYQDNKERILARQTRPFHCVCGTTCCRNVKARHFRSQKHQDWLNQQQEEQEQPLEKLD